jgi:hypothetical protein
MRRKASATPGRSRSASRGENVSFASTTNGAVPAGAWISIIESGRNGSVLPGVEYWAVDRSTFQFPGSIPRSRAIA